MFHYLVLKMIVNKGEPPAHFHLDSVPCAKVYHVFKNGCLLYISKATKRIVMSCNIWKTPGPSLNNSSSRGMMHLERLFLFKCFDFCMQHIFLVLFYAHLKYGYISASSIFSYNVLNLLPLLHNHLITLRINFQLI